MTSAEKTDVYYDPFDFEIDNDPYPVWKRLRDEAPLYYNEKFNFFALSRYADVAPALNDWEKFLSGRGTTADLLLSGAEIPRGSFCGRIRQFTTLTGGCCHGFSRPAEWRRSKG